MNMFVGCDTLVGVKVINPPADFESVTKIRHDQYEVVTKTNVDTDFNLSINITNDYRSLKKYMSTKDPGSTMGTLSPAILAELNGVKANNVSKMFERSAVTDIPNLHIDTSKVEDFSGMFGWCSGLSTIDTSWIDTSSATNMNEMFAATNVTTLDLTHFDTSKVKDFGDMFNRCSNLTTITGIIDMTSSTNCEGMFDECTNLTGVKIFNPPLDFEDKCGLTHDQYVIVKSK